MASLVAIVGVTVLATEPAATQDVEPEPKSPFTERMTYRFWSAPDSRFNNPRKVDTYRKEVKGKLFICISKASPTGGNPPVGSEVTDKDGVTWVVTKSSVADVYICEVVKRPAPKKKK